ncbi:MAG: chemotaxis protein CheA [Armatimonadetes bacterium]|nr:chemotaxis protein CheA [Armatimonadota bacterium]
MRRKRQRFIESLLAIAEEAKNLTPDSGDTIIRIGADIEQLLETQDIPSELKQFLELGIESLKALHLKTAHNPHELAEALKRSFSTLEQCTEQASEDELKDILVEEANALRSAMDPAVKENEHSETCAPVSLDDIAAFLIQVEPSDTRAVSNLRDILTSADTSDYPAEVQAAISAACQLVEDLPGKSANDATETLAEIGRLVEAAMNIMANGSQSADSQEQPEADETHATEPSTSQAALISTADSVQWALAPDADPGLLSDFTAECGDYIEKAEAALLALESNPDDAEAINTVFRAFHTIKGTSAFLDLSHISELAHLAESLLDRMRDGEIRCTGKYADLALQATDMLKELIQGVQGAISGSPMQRPARYDDLMVVLSNPESLGEESPSEPFERALWPEDVTIVSEDAETVASEIASTVKVPTDTSTKNEPLLAEVTQAIQAQKAPSQEVKPESFVRVRTDRLDRLIDMVGELVIAQSMVSQDETVVLGDNHELSKKVVQLGKIVRELQYLSMSMRMVPLKPTFQKAARMVRDLAQKCGKKIVFVAEGEETEIDRNMVDLINDPLVHMIRNAVDHGIEPPDEREKAGKPCEGVVKLSAYHAGGNVVVALSDDGRGLDKHKIVEKAVAKGLVPPGKALTDAEIYNLIFAPGFSTADAVTEVSGRGVGMDVVKKNIEALRGRIDISSEPGKGSCFIIRLPLTMAVTDGMLVRVGEERFIIPTINIRLSFRPEPESLSTVVGQGEMVMLRGELMPIFRLHRLFDIQGATDDPAKGLLVIVDDGEKHCALLVDEILGQQHVVAKSLGEGVGKVQGLSGGAILGDGCVGLILDTTEIVALARQQTARVGNEGVKHRSAA